MIDKTQPPPDRLCAEKVSAFYNKEMLEAIDIYVDGEKQEAVIIEYCISGRWVRSYLKGAAPGEFQKNVRGDGLRIKKLQNRDIRVEWK